MFAIVILIGLFLAKKVGLGLPILESWLEGRKVKGYLKSILGISIGLGIVAGILITGLDYLFSFAGATINVAQASVNPPVWQGFLASFYGGINEEILLRLFLMTLLVWIFFKIKKTSDGKPTKTGIWLAIILAAVFLRHRPPTCRNDYNSTYTPGGCTHYHFKCCRWNYIWMALLEERA